MNELSSPVPMYGGDQELSRQVEDLAAQTAGGSGMLLPEGHVPGDVISGIPINPDFNNGVPNGPWQTSEVELQQWKDAGYDEVHSRAVLHAKDQLAALTRNTYPVGAPEGSVMSELKASLEQTEKTERDKAQYLTDENSGYTKTVRKHMTTEGADKGRFKDTGLVQEHANYENHLYDQHGSGAIEVGMGDSRLLRELGAEAAADSSGSLVAEEVADTLNMSGVSSASEKKKRLQHNMQQIQDNVTATVRDANVLMKEAETTAKQERA